MNISLTSKRSVEISAYIVLLVIGCGLAYHHVASIVHDRTVYIQPGQHIHRLPGVTWGSHTRTLVLALKTDCPYCEANMAFYQQLASLHPPEGSNEFYVTAIFPEKGPIVKKELDVHNLHLPVISGVNLGALRIPGTPTILILNSQGEITNVWFGTLTAPRQQEVIHALRQGT